MVAVITPARNIISSISSSVASMVVLYTKIKDWQVESV